MRGTSYKSFSAPLAPSTGLFLAADSGDAKSACRYCVDLPPVPDDLGERMLVLNSMGIKCRE